MNWNELVKKIEDSVEVDRALGQKLHKRVREARVRGVRQKGWGVFMVRPTFVVVAVFAIAFLLTQINRYEQGRPISFIESAIAVSRAQDESLGEGLVRHMALTMAMSGSDTIATDVWVDGRSGAYLSKMVNQETGDIVHEMLYREGVAYFSPRMIQIMEEEEDIQAERERDDEGLLPFDVAFPEGISGAGSEGEVDGGWEVCFQGEGITGEMSEGADVMKKMEEALGVQRETGLPNISRALELLTGSDLVSDMGERQDAGLGVVHVYRLAMHDEDGGLSGVDYIFDAATKKIRQIRRWQGSGAGVSEGYSEMTIQVDEIRGRADLPEDFFDPEKQNFIPYEEKRAQDLRPVVQIPGEGCYLIDEETLTVSKEE